MPKLYEMLDTKKVKEQEKRVEQLIQSARTPVMSVMILMDPRNGRLDVRAAGIDNPGVEDIKYVLRQAVDTLTAQAIQAEMERPPQLNDALAGEVVDLDEPIDGKVVPEEHPVATLSDEALAGGLPETGAVPDLPENQEEDFNPT